MDRQASDIKVLQESIIKVEEFKEEPVESCSGSLKMNHGNYITEEYETSPMQNAVKMEHNAEEDELEPPMVVFVEPEEEREIICIDEEDPLAPSGSECAFTNKMEDSRFSGEVNPEGYSVQDEARLRLYSPERPFECSTCRKRFKQPAHLRGHMLTHTGEKPFECAVCKKRFTKKGNLTTHMLLHTGEKAFTCSICGKGYTQLRHFREHRRSHTGGLNAEGCSLRYNALETRMKIHSHEKPFECSICQKRFTENAFLRRHIRTHTGEKPFECSICLKKFAESTYLRRHMRTHTGEKAFECSICSKRFAEKHVLARHIITHTGEKPFECSMCLKRFTQKEHMESHIRTHTGEKPFQCSICLKRFSRKQELQKHMLINCGQMNRSEAQIAQWLVEEIDEEVDIGLPDEFEHSEDSDVEEANNSNHDSDSEQSAGEEEIVTEPRVHYLGKNQTTTWNAHPPCQQTRRRRRNIVLHPPGVKGDAAKSAATVFEAWKMFFPDDVIEEISMYTNDRLHKIRSKYKREYDVVDTNPEEIAAVLGLLYMAGVQKVSHQVVQDLWSTDGTAPEYFRFVMSYRRFLLLLRALSFDDDKTRRERKALDKLAPIRTIFENFVQRCKESYSIGEYTTVDEVLVPFRGRCPFRQYMPKKPARYGIKIFSLADSRMFYTSNMEVYVPNQPTGLYSLDTRPSSVVKRLTEHIRNSGRNVTMDNWFTSIPLTVELLQSNLTVVGTLKKNKAELPPEIVNTKARPVNSSLFAFREECTVVSYVPKKSRNVILVSSIHDSEEIDETPGDKEKPAIVTFYNLTKGGVDVVDKMKSQYSVARMCCRWPLRIFFSLLDVGAINAQIILFCNTNERMERKKFLKQLSFDLTRDHMVTRSLKEGIHSDLRIRIMKYLHLPEKKILPNPVSNERIKCTFCPKKKNRFTTVRCNICISPICGEHAISLCHMCHGNNVNSEITD